MVDSCPVCHLANYHDHDLEARLCLGDVISEGQSMWVVLTRASKVWIWFKALTLQAFFD